MTHEFKTPLSSILLASNYLINQEQIFNNDKFNKYTEIIINQSKKLNEHIETILNVAKSDYSPLNLKLENIKIVELIEEVLENIKLKHPTIDCKIEYDEDYTIKADMFHFKNIIDNLIDNSIKYNLNNPIILIKIFKLKPNSINIDLIDNGIGIPKEKLKYIFDKFYRVSELNTSAKGFGLGLYYVKKIVDLHKWKIYVVNNRYEGLTVTLILNTTKYYNE